MVPTEGRVLAGRYRLESRLAAGGMGEVWVARDERLHRPVALKLMRDDLARDPVAVERFRREALTAAALDHPNIASVLDYVADDGRLGIVMEYVRGETVAERIRREGRLPVGDVVHLGRELLGALGAAHAAGVVHRDVKPGNVLLDAHGAVKVADFGIASVRGGGTATLTDTGTVIGTATYMAPEQLDGRPVSPRTDLYAVGIVLYEALTGTPPFEADTPAAAAVARLTRPPRPVRELRSEVPPAVAAVVMRALEPDPEHRFASAAEMRSALLEAASDTRPLTRPHAPVARADITRGLEQRPPVRRRRYAVAGALLVGLLLAGAAVAARSRGPATVRVPAGVGQPVEEVVGQLRQLDLQPVVQVADAVQPKGTVLGQDIAPGTAVVAGTTVTLSVSSGRPPCCTVPSVLGMSPDQAAVALTGAGLTQGRVRVAAVDGSSGTVVRQDPPPGTVVQPGAPVDLVVAATTDTGPGRGNKKQDQGGGGD